MCEYDKQFAEIKSSHLKLHVDAKYTKGYITSHRERAQDVLALKKKK